MLVYVYAFESIIIIITVEIVESVIVQLIFILIDFYWGVLSVQSSPVLSVLGQSWPNG